MDSDYAYGGYTETVSLKAVRVSELWSEVCAAAEEILAESGPPDDMPKILGDRRLKTV